MPKLIIKLNPALSKRREGSMLSKSNESGVTYPTYRRMALGLWHPGALDVLERFLSVQGFAVEELREAQFADIFVVEEVGDDPERV